ECCPADPAACAVSPRSCGGGIFPTGKATGTNRWSWSPRHTPSRTTPLRKARRGRGRERRQSGHEQIGVDPPVAVLVGVGQRVARNLSPETHMIELGLLSAKTSFDIAEAFAIGELSKSQTEELIPAGEIFDVAIALVALDANLKLVG